MVYIVDVVGELREELALEPVTTPEEHDSEGDPCWVSELWAHSSSCTCYSVAKESLKFVED